MREIELTIKVPPGLAKFYQHYAHFINKPLETILRGELSELATSLVDLMSPLPGFEPEDAAKKYGLAL